MTSTKQVTPVFLWAQDANSLFLTIDLLNPIKDKKFTITSDHLFSGSSTSGDKLYELSFDFNDAIVEKLLNIMIVV